LKSYHRIAYGLYRAWEWVSEGEKGYEGLVAFVKEKLPGMVLKGG